MDLSAANIELWSPIIQTGIIAGLIVLANVLRRKISFIRNEEDVSDVTDELCDRYGEPPKAVLRLLHVAALRAMASEARIAKIDEKDGCLRFFGDAPDLAVWSLLFETHKDLRFVAAAGAPAVVYRPPKGEEGVYAAYKLLTEYLAARRSSLEGEKE